jgi:hypothetical protein
MTPDPDTLSYTTDQLCKRIAVLTGSIMDFWSGSGGWAPDNAAALLDKSMLRWQVSLTQSLSHWGDTGSEGDLILAWANLGALVEGQLKLFLCVYYNDYKAGIDGIRRRSKLVDPDECSFQELRQFFIKRIWVVGINWNPYVEFVQQRRNAVHAFKHREIGSFTEWSDALRLHLSFVRDIGGRLPYPDGYNVAREE